MSLAEKNLEKFLDRLLSRSTSYNLTHTIPILFGIKNFNANRKLIFKNLFGPLKTKSNFNLFSLRFSRTEADRHAKKIKKNLLKFSWDDRTKLYLLSFG